MKDKQPTSAPLPDVWDRVARTVAPLKSGSSKPSGSVPPGFMRVPHPHPQKRRPENRLIGTRADKKTRRGQVNIDTRIDLHGLTVPQGFESLRRTIIRAYNQNLKCVLVITGKGVRGHGLLRQNFPLWLQHPDINPVIAEYSPAHLLHGGNGAWYVFLKTH